MPDTHVAEHLLEQIVEVRAVSDIFKISFVSLLSRFAVKPVQGWVIEEVALNAPDFTVHLLPLCARVYVDFHLAEVDRTLARLERLSGRGDGEALGRAEALAEDHLFTVRRQIKCGHVLKRLFKLALIKLELVNNDSGSGRACRTLKYEKHAGLARPHPYVVARRDWKRKNALANVVKIYVYLWYLFFLR